MLASRALVNSSPSPAWLCRRPLRSPDRRTCVVFLSGAPTLQMTCSPRLHLTRPPLRSPSRLRPTSNPKLHRSPSRNPCNGLVGLFLFSLVGPMLNDVTKPTNDSWKVRSQVEDSIIGLGRLRCCNYTTFLKEALSLIKETLLLPSCSRSQKLGFCFIVRFLPGALARPVSPDVAIFNGDSSKGGARRIMLVSVTEELKETGKFGLMDLDADEREHSMEMHLPYIAKVFHG
ncbi:hypothetical protein AXF42_Ash001261 [Apostasia shenzhenica]|uniref:Uncharacterized protein n=1 Tax=Apostasia shenzhenica TaxID=1088818 RepID=A0A2I0AUE9_9ASPA|nr:hypothetical protein AXF42_Ash001261 [Apostasia shenzhenica]